MKWKLVLALTLAVAVFIGVFGASSAEADVTFENNSDRKVFVAVWEEGAIAITRGWFGIDRGNTWVWKDHPPSNIGYYAEGTKDGKKLYWRGDWNKGWIHPKNAFRLDGWSGGPVQDGGGAPRIQGAIQVGFREIRLDNSGNATINIRN